MEEIARSMVVGRDSREPRPPAGLKLGVVELGPVLMLLGGLVAAMGVSMVVPLLVDLLVHNRDWVGFLQAGLLAICVGSLLVAATYRRPITLSLRQGFLLTALAWVALSLVGSLPYMLATPQMTFSDAMFESVSGLTTTGSTVMAGLDTTAPGILFWRAYEQWLGGIGIIAMAIVLLPVLRVGGMQLFRMESSDTTDKGALRISQIGMALVSVYLGLTGVIALGYLFAGMSAFDAVCHAFSTISTGGYANYDSSMGHFGPVIHWIAVGGMIAGSVPFLLYWQVLRGQPWRFWRDAQVRMLIVFLVCSWVVMGGWLSWTTGRPLFEAVTSAAFNITSVVTTTGYASEDYTLWGSFAVLFFLLITFAGGCTGSTSGGVKMFRWLVAWMVLDAHVRRRFLPHAVILFTINNRTVDEDVQTSVVLFFFAVSAVICFSAMAIAFFGVDWVTALTGAIQAVNNVGPGLGDVIGPAGNFATLPDPAKWILAMAMLLGRLEVFTFLVLISRSFWRT